MVEQLGLGLKKKILEHQIYRYLSRLALTRNEDDFYSEFDTVLKGLYKFAGPNKPALENVMRAFQRKHPLTELARLILQKRLSKVARERLARNFFCDWITEAKSREKLEEEGFKAPWFFVISPTNTCNLNCYGCYAHEYQKGQGLSYATLDRIVKEAKELGVRFLTISGGEPFYYRDKETGKDLWDLAKKHNDMYFQIYTNGTLLDEKTIERLAKIGNIAPAISMEGFEKETDERRGRGVWEKINKARQDLYQAGVLQGFSVTVTRQNAEVVTSDEFMDNLIANNISFGWYFIYIPIGKSPAVELMPTPEQRSKLREKIWEWRSKKPIFIGDFWDDGPWVGGCIASGRKYFHINSKGDIEPCVFVHFAVDNIFNLWKEGKGLREAIHSPFFFSIRRKQLEKNDNFLTPCSIIDKPEILREAVREHNAYPTHKGAETIIEGKIAHFLDDYSKRLDELTRPEFEKMVAGEYDSSVVKLSKTIENHRRKNREELEIQEKAAKEKTTSRGKRKK
ncbi:MAG TPA: radical SAM protein [Candidatus Aminicenantes bacterium]|nr:radical SAM protein [Candidatus Aminicenantes bacterium]